MIANLLELFSEQLFIPFSRDAFETRIETRQVLRERSRRSELRFEIENVATW